MNVLHLFLFFHVPIYANTGTNCVGNVIGSAAYIDMIALLKSALMSDATVAELKRKYLLIIYVYLRAERC